MSAREDVIQAFNDSAAMEGNEPHFIRALDAYREEVRRETLAEVQDHGRLQAIGSKGPLELDPLGTFTARTWPG